MNLVGFLFTYLPSYISRKFLQEKKWKPSRKNEKKQEETHRPKSEEHGGMPQHRQHYPPAKHTEDKNPKYHEEQEKALQEFSPVYITNKK
jgi:hypothetical protein